MALFMQALYFTNVPLHFTSYHFVDVLSISQEKRII